MNDLYNDLGFKIGNRLLILVEAQSTWSENILVRAFLYLAQNIQKHLWDTKQFIYGTTKVTFPKPEIYVLYTGNKESLAKGKMLPNEITLCKDFFDSDSGSLDVKVKMVYDGKKGDIISQYVMFTKIFREQLQIHGRSRETLLETIRICKDQNVLREYLKPRESEAIDIMITLYDNDEIIADYVKDEKKSQGRKRKNDESGGRKSKSGGNESRAGCKNASSTRTVGRTDCQTV